MKRDFKPPSIFKMKNKMAKFDNVAKPEDCVELAEYAISRRQKELSLDEIEGRHQSYTLMLRSMILSLSQSHFEETLYPMETRLVIYQDGDDMGWHNDYSGKDLDEARPDDCMRRYSATMYLNDTYDGGQLVLQDTEKDVPVDAVPGRVVLYAAHIIHGTRPVVGGPRVTMNMSMTHIRSESEVASE